PADISREAFVADVVAVLDELDCREPVMLVGQSIGAHTAFLTAAWPLAAGADDARVGRTRRPRRRAGRTDVCGAARDRSGGDPRRGARCAPGATRGVDRYVTAHPGGRN